jgi:predicted transposase YdaD
VIAIALRDEDLIIYTSVGWVEHRLFQTIGINTQDIMKESVIYQEIFETGEQRALQREKALILRQVSRQVGEVPQDLRSSVELLSIDRLEALGEALLDFNSLQDLQNWFGMN